MNNEEINPSSSPISTPTINIPLPSVPPDIASNRAESVKEDDSFNGIDTIKTEIRNIVKILQQAKTRGCKGEDFREYIAKHIRPEDFILTETQYEPYCYRSVYKALQSGSVKL